MNKRIILAIVTVFTLCVACRKLVQDEFPDFDPKPVINSILVNGQPIRMHVSMAQKLDQNPLQGMDDAEVLLFEDSIFVEKLTVEGNGLYSSSVIAQSGKTYSFSIAVPGHETIHTATKVPVAQQIVDIKHFKNMGIDADGIPIPCIFITFSNNTQEKTYYQILMKYSIWVSIGLKESIEASILNINDPVLLNESIPMPIFSNEKIKDSVYKMQIQYTTHSYEMYPLIVELRTIDSAYYHYLQSLYLYERGRFGSNIGEVYPNYSLYSNIKNGYGITAAYSSVTFDTVFPENR